MQIAMKEYNIKFIVFSETPIDTSFYLFPQCDLLPNIISYKKSDHLVEEEQKNALSVSSEDRLFTLCNIKFTHGYNTKDYLLKKSLKVLRKLDRKVPLDHYMCYFHDI